MPRVQRGQVSQAASGRWVARWYEPGGDDEPDRRRARGGFETKSAAWAFADAKVEEVAALRRGDPAALRRQDMPTLGELVVEFVGQHNAEPSTIASLEKRLRYALDGPKLDGTGGWRHVRLDRLQAHEIGAWRKRLPARSAYGIHKALRQVLHYAVRAKLIDENPATVAPNPEPKRTEVVTFALDELELVGAELDPRYRGLPVFAALTGLRPCEWMALERGDVDRRAGVVHVRRTLVDGQVKGYGKTDRSLRTLPLPARAALALDEQPPRLDSRLLFPAVRGGHLELNAWRWRDWYPALRAAGIERRVPYALRHTFASLAIAAGVSLFELSRFMGTSPQMLDRTYGHLLPDALDRGRAALDSFLSPVSGRAAASDADGD